MGLFNQFSTTGTIEPDVDTTPPPPKYPTSGRASSSSSSSPPSANPYVNLTYQPPTPSTPPAYVYTMRDWRSYIPSYSLTNLTGADRLRRIACLVAFVIHVPINVLWIYAHGFNFWIFLWVLLALLNILCVGFGLQRLESMVGQRTLFTRTLTRTHFDYIILFILSVYGIIVILLALALARIRGSGKLLTVMWPCLIVADLTCFVAGWVAAWRDGMVLV